MRKLLKSNGLIFNILLIERPFIDITKRRARSQQSTRWQPKNVERKVERQTLSWGNNQARPICNRFNISNYKGNANWLKNCFSIYVIICVVVHIFYLMFDLVCGRNLERKLQNAVGKSIVEVFWAEFSDATVVRCKVRSTKLNLGHIFRYQSYDNLGTVGPTRQFPRFCMLFKLISAGTCLRVFLRIASQARLTLDIKESLKIIPL